MLADLPGLRLPKNVLLTKEQRGEGSSAASLRFRNSSHRLMLRIHNKVRHRVQGLGLPQNPRPGFQWV